MRENTKLIQQTLFDLQQRFGANAVGVLGDRVREVDLIPTGFAALDAALGQGGIRRGQLSALVGTPTSGATTLALKLLATAQGRYEVAVYLDVPGTFDAEIAVEYGVALDRLLVVQPTDDARALDLIYELVKSGRAALIVLDLLAASLLPDPVALRRLQEAVTRTRTAALILLPALPKALEPYPQTALALRQADWLRDFGDVVGYRVQVTLLKNKPYSAGQSLMLDVALDPRSEGDAL